MRSTGFLKRGPTEAVQRRFDRDSNKASMRTVPRQGRAATEPTSAPLTGAPGSGLSPARITLAIMLLVFCGVWFSSLGTRALLTPDEGRYASLALQMAHTGDWVTPRLNGLLYFEKPPLQYWIGAIAFRLFGVSEFTARLWPGLAGFLTLLLVGFTARRLWGPAAGVRAFAIAASMSWIFANSHFLSLDTGLMFFLTLVLSAVLVANACAAGDVPQRRRWILLAWAAMAGAVLSKGLVGMAIPAAVLLIVSLWRRDAQLLKGMHWIPGLSILLALTLPWFVLVSVRNPSFAQFFFIHEHFARYTSGVHHRLGAWWYFVPFLLCGMLPWTSTLPWLIEPRRRLLAERRGIGNHDILVVWCVFVFVFFSASGSKLPSYILPMFPALALLVTARLDTASPAALRWHLVGMVGVWSLLFAVSTQFGRFPAMRAAADLLAPMALAARVGTAVFVAAAAVALWCLGRQRRTAAVLCVAMGHFLAISLLMQAHDHYGRQRKSAALLAPVIAREVGSDAPVFAVQSYDQTLPFYLQRNVILVDYGDEFAPGQAIEPERWVPMLDDFITRWQALPQAAAYMSPATRNALQQRGLPMRTVFEDQRRVVVTRR